MIDINKKYRTRDGREVRIYSVDADNLDTVHGAYLHKDGKWMVASWSWYGARCDAEETIMDLVEMKPRIQKTVWLHIFNSGNIVVSDEPAVCNITHRIACVKVKIDCEEGEGL